MESLTKIRIGNTIQVRVTVLTNGEAVSLEGRNITVLLVDPRGAKTKMPYTLSGSNVVVFTCQGRSQSVLGSYEVEVYENLNSTNQRVFDTRAFILVRQSRQETDVITDIVTPVVEVELSGSLLISGADVASITLGVDMETGMLYAEQS